LNNSNNINVFYKSDDPHPFLVNGATNDVGGGGESRDGDNSVLLPASAYKRNLLAGIQERQRVSSH
jgi:hypothetical protein